MQREFDLQPYLINHQAKPGERSWVKIFTYEPAEEEVLASRGQMYAVLSVSARVPLDFGPIMQLIMESLHRDYFGKTEGTILQALESALDGIHKQLILMAQQDKRLSSGFSFNLLTAVSWGTTLYFGQLGASRASLMRKGVLYDIDEGAQKTTGLYLSSGQVRAGDRILLATQELFEGVSREVLTSHLAKEGQEIAVGMESALKEGGSGAEKSKQSGIVLVVDIKQVPTLEDEGLRIGSLDDLPQSRSKKSKRSATWMPKVRGVAASLWSWRVGKVPGLPLVVAVLAVLALVASMLMQEPELPQEANTAALTSLRTSVSKQLSDAETILAVNPDRAYDLVEEAGGWLGQGFESYPDDEELRRLAKQLEAVKDKIVLGEELDTSRLATVEVRPTSKKLVVMDEQIVVLDSHGQRLVLVTPEGRTSNSASSNRFSGNSLLTATERGMLLTESGQAYVVSDRGQIGSGRSLSNISQIEAIASFSTNGYALSRAGQVIRIPLTGSGVGNPSAYFNQPLSGDDYMDLAVDGNVYLLRQNGQIESYRNQSRQSLLLERSGLLKSPQALFTTAEADYLMVLQDGSLWLWDKKGGYIGQRRLANNQVIEAVGVDAAMETVYILSNNALLRAEL